MSRIPLPPVAGADAHVSLELVTSAVTLPGDRVVDELSSPQEATEWLLQRGLVPEGTALLNYCQNQLGGLREVLRLLFTAHVDGEAPPQGVLDAVNRALTTAPSVPVLRFDPGQGLHRESQHPVTQVVEHAMAQIAEDAADLVTGADASLLARCSAAPCDRFFLRTHARRQWCSTRCGDRVRAARAYARKRDRALDPTPAG